MNVSLNFSLSKRNSTSVFYWTFEGYLRIVLPLKVTRNLVSMCTIAISFHKCWDYWRSWRPSSWSGRGKTAWWNDCWTVIWDLLRSQWYRCHQSVWRTIVFCVLPDTVASPLEVQQYIRAMCPHECFPNASIQWGPGSKSLVRGLCPSEADSILSSARHITGPLLHEISLNSYVEDMIKFLI